MTMHYSTKRWQDQVIVLLGLWLIVSPWALAFSDDNTLTTNACVAGVVMAILAACDLYKTYLWAVLLNLLIGGWVAVSPWALQLAGRREAMGNAVIIGVATVVLGLWELRSDPELHRQWAGSGPAT